MKYSVTKTHVSEFPNPVELTKGEKVKIGKDPDPTMNPDTWVNWLYCIKADGSNEGFVPAQIVQQDGDKGTMLDVSSSRLSVLCRFFG